MAKEGVDHGRCSIRISFVHRWDADSLVTRKTRNIGGMMYNEYALTGRVRHDKRVGNWQDKRDALNPLLKVRGSNLEDKFSYHLKLRNEAWGSVGEYDREAWKNYTDTEIRPVLDALRTARTMFFCSHKEQVDNGDCLYCPECGAADYGLGWDCVSGV